MQSCCSLADVTSKCSIACMVQYTQVAILSSKLKSLQNSQNYTTLCLKQVPTFKLSVTLSNLNQFQKFLHYWKAYEICYKTQQHYPPHLRQVATLLWEIKNLNFPQIFGRYGRKCKQIAF